MITNLQIENFKSLKGININFGTLNFVVGPNASGKSNFSEALDFLSHAVRETLSYAVAEKGGFYNICHRRQRRARGGISFVVKTSHEIRKTIYDVSLAFELRAKSEEIRADFFVASEELDIKLINATNGREIQLRIWREDDRYKIYHSRDDFNENDLTQLQRRLVKTFEWLEDVFNDEEPIRALPQQLLVSGILKGYPAIAAAVREVQGLRVYQLNPRVARQPAAPSVHGELGRRGENLASALDKMRIDDSKSFVKLGSWLKDVVPSLEGIITNYTETRQLGLFFQEEGFASRWFAEDVSDGTIMSVSLFFVLLDKRHKQIVIEEPETSLHPWILKNFIERCREMSESRQIIITTHSPLAVAHAKPDELYLVERNDGVTNIRKAIDIEPKLSEIIRKDLIDLGQYWISGGLGAVPKVADDGSSDLFG